MHRTFKQWLSWMEKCHPVEIELGLERCNRVLKRLLITDFTFPIVTVAGTNGKGSTVAVIESLAREANIKPLVLTSPHFLDYRERLRFDGCWLTEQQHINAFECVELARQTESLTYFEFSTLAALKCAEILQPDLLILETGLGGRLDAVNIVAADMAIITTVDFDHQAWLGDDLESIAREKAGIIHENSIAIIADPNFPQLIINEIKLVSNDLNIANQAYQQFDKIDSWSWQNNKYGPWEFDFPSFPFANAAAAIQAWSLLLERFPDMVAETVVLSEQFIRTALANIILVGRFDIVATDPLVILDVAHNPQAFRALRSSLDKHPVKGNTYVVLGMLVDKNVESCINSIKALVDRWYLTDLQTSRGHSANSLKQLFSHSEIDENRLQCQSSPEAAFRSAYANASKDDRIIVTGSFYTVAPVLELFQQSSEEPERVE